jgi:hypothetical protein
VIVDSVNAVQQMYAHAGIDLSRRGHYLRRIRVLLTGLSEDELLIIGKQISTIVKKAA